MLHDTMLWLVMEHVKWKFSFIFFLYYVLHGWCKTVRTIVTSIITILEDMASNCCESIRRNNTLQKGKIEQISQHSKKHISKWFQHSWINLIWVQTFVSIQKNKRLWTPSDEIALCSFCMHRRYSIGHPTSLSGLQTKEYNVFNMIHYSAWLKALISFTSLSEVMPHCRCLFLQTGDKTTLRLLPSRLSDLCSHCFLDYVRR